MTAPGGSPPGANRLAAEASAYLRQHARNPVDWYPWSPEAFAAARALDRPIFLSIGYSACHWCHVMAHESFEDRDIAAYLNENFVSIKVDREERPDVDMIYQRVAQVMGEPGGWPLSVFLLPDGRPFWVGTYFPPEDRYGRPGFPRVLRAVAEAFRERRRELEELADRVVEALAAVERPARGGKAGTAGAPPGPALDAAFLHDAADRLARFFDDRHGGFGRAPKFPSTTALALLWRGGQVDRVLFTLRRMAAGGIYDHLGGGFHRYAVDEAWRIPHFEKMLYDNALLPPLYLDAYRLTGDEAFARTAAETLDYVLAEMRDPEGGFYASQDADAGGREGGSYVWRPEELRAVLDPEDARLAAAHYGVTEEGNFEDGATVLHVARSPAELAAETGLAEDEVRARLDAARRRLLEARRRRPQPGTDTKIIAAWNGLMIAALADGAWCLGERRYLDAACEAARFILTRMRDDGGGLMRTFQEGRARFPGFLDDYAFTILGLLKLHEASLDPHWVREALELVPVMLARFWDEAAGCFFYTPSGTVPGTAAPAAAAPPAAAARAAGDGEPLVHRPRDVHDTAIPSSLAAAVTALIRLLPFAPEGRRRQWSSAVERVLSLYRDEAAANPFAFAALILAAGEWAQGPVEVTLAAPPGDAGAVARLRRWHSRLGRLAVPGLLVTAVPGAVTDAVHSAVAGAAPGAADAPIWAGREPRGARATAYVCRNFTCSPPLHAWDEIARRLAVQEVQAGQGRSPAPAGAPDEDQDWRLR
ncbi:MAG: thioredoxin domain-containing protein [Bacillota bacterium]